MKIKSRVLKPHHIRFLKDHFRLDWQGIHGASHWARVRNNGLYLSKHHNINTKVTELFAFFHDSERHDEGLDPEHGPRAAALVRKLGGEFFGVTDEELMLLIDACNGHTKYPSHENLTIQACWDSDRLDLSRAGITPDPNRLGCTAAKNKNFIAKCIEAGDQHRIKLYGF